MPKRISLPALLVACGMASAAQGQGVLHVCANPDNLPFSNQEGEGFENKLAQLIARDLHDRVSYTWTNEHEHFVRKTINAGKCDVLMGVPAEFDEVETTAPYYMSGYVFVTRRDRALGLSSIRDPRLHNLKIGVHLIGDENTPPLEAFARQGITGNISGYMIFRDTQVKGHSRLVDDLATGKVDVAAVWGPLGGYYAKRAKVPLRISFITETASFAPAAFHFAMSLGVRKGNEPLKAALNGVITREKPAIRNLLRSYGIPMVEMPARAAGG